MSAERITQTLHSGQSVELAQKVAGLPHLERERHQRYIRDFHLPHDINIKLDPHQKRMLSHLEEAAKGFETIFAAQVGKDERAHFYPRRVSKSFVEKANEENPDILSHYTVVVLTHDEKLITYPMHVAYRRLLNESGVLDHLKEAARQAGKGRKKDIQFKRYLEAKIKAFQTGEYEESERLWLSRDDEPEIDIVIGFYDTYTDKWLQRKYAGQAWTGVIDRELTANSQWFLNSFLAWWEKESQQQSPKVKMRIDHTTIMSGQAAPYKWTGNSLPCQIEWRQEYGSKFTIFKPVFEDGLNLRLEAYRTLIDGNKRMGVSDELVKTANLRRYIAHEICHSLNVAQDIDHRLQDHTAWIKELYCDLLALKGYFNFGGVSMRERELAFATSFANGSVEYDTFLREGKREEYHLASSILLKYCLEKGSVRIEGNQLTWDYPGQVISDVAALFDTVNEIQLQGKVRDADELLVKFYDPVLYPKLMVRGASLPTLVRKAQQRIKQPLV